VKSYNVILNLVNIILCWINSVNEEREISIKFNCIVLGFSDKERVDIHSTLQKAQDFIEASVFNRAKNHAVERLEQAWIHYLKEDLKSFLE